MHGTLSPCYCSCTQQSLELRLARNSLTLLLFLHATFSGIGLAFGTSERGNLCIHCSQSYLQRTGLLLQRARLEQLGQTSLGLEGNILR